MYSLFLRIIFTILFIVSIKVGESQTKQNYSWIVGYGNSNVVKFENSNFLFQKLFDTLFLPSRNFIPGSNICNTNGNIILLSNGVSVIDSNKNFVGNLDSIGGREFVKYNSGDCPYTQYSIFLPLQNNIYYFVNNSVSDSFWAYYNNTGGLDFNFDELLYCKIDMNGNNGLGICTKREVKLIEKDTLSNTQMMACRHGNGKDWWLFKQGSIKNIVHKFLFTQDSVFNFGTQSFAEPEFSKWDNGGQSMFSQDGTKYATTCTGTKKIFVADFNRCSGELSNPLVYDVPPLSAHNTFDSTMVDVLSEGLAFSPNGRFLYLNMYYNIQQLDLLDSDTSTRWSVVAGLDTTWDAFNSYSSMYLGPDNKLYVGNWGGLSKQMSYFDTPNIKGVGSGFCPRCLRFPKVGVTAPPCMPNYDLGALLDNGCDTTKPLPIPIGVDIIIVPNAFTPNGDGKNDVWHILNLPYLYQEGITIEQVEVYNRWGNKVYSSRDIDFAWNGSGWASDNYFYFIRYKTKAGMHKIQKGNIVLIR